MDRKRWRRTGASQCSVRRLANDLVRGVYKQSRRYLMRDAQPTAATAACCLLLVGVGGCGDGPTTPRPLVLSVEVQPEVLTLVEGDTADLNAVVTTEGGASRAVQWSSTLDSVVTVDSAGRVAARPVRDPAQAGVVATSVADTTKKDSAQVTVEPKSCPAVNPVSIVPSSATVAVAETADFDASVSVDSARVISWTSGDTTVATVDSTGTARGESVGSTDITATVDLLPDDRICHGGIESASASLEVVNN